MLLSISKLDIVLAFIKTKENNKAIIKEKFFVAIYIYRVTIDSLFAGQSLQQNL
ncbi:hypothetical protein FTS_0471 [Francisella tularensis subsp. holarctica FSC200]|nr:hypothetical protein FTH_0466 [Francisella tularensis subsp. holarctica OSU18]AFT92399.1 hypothetical protein FTS_0471 [Francisella tularensis subsp. holarctica FSC200]